MTFRALLHLLRSRRSLYDMRRGSRSIQTGSLRCFKYSSEHLRIHLKQLFKSQKNVPRILNSRVVQIEICCCLAVCGVLMSFNSVILLEIEGSKKLALDPD